MKKKKDDVTELVDMAEQRLVELKSALSQHGEDSMQFRMANSMVMVPLKIIDEIVYGP